MSGLPPLPSPGGYERAYAESYNLAFSRLRQADLADVCLKSGAVFLDADTIQLRFLNREYRIARLPGTVTLVPETEPVPVGESLLILHYLVTARGTPSGTGQISFKEVPEGVVYYPTFYKRAIRPLLARFGAAPAGLLPAAAVFGGVDAHQGDAAVTVQAFPKVAVTWVLWKGDDEFPAEGTILVDRNIQDYLPTEDIVVLCQTIAIKLCRAA
ncbi:MAG: DUF3786 domain-containing protein [Syntrophales bacterium]